MRILCDHHVPPKYVQAFEQEPAITVTTVRDSLTHDASDAEIAAFTKREDWIVYTNDDDFYRHTPSHGLVVYNQRENPAPGAVVDAMIAIDRAYVSPAEIHELSPMAGYRKRGGFLGRCPFASVSLACTGDTLTQRRNCFRRRWATIPQ